MIKKKNKKKNSTYPNFFEYVTPNTYIIFFFFGLNKQCSPHIVPPFNWFSIDLLNWLVLYERNVSRIQISHLISSEFQRINELLLPLRSSENPGFLIISEGIEAN